MVPGHGGDGGGDDRPPPYQVRGTPKAQLGGQRADRPPGDPEPRVKAITDKSGPVPIRFEVNDRETLMPLGDHAAHWANYLSALTPVLTSTPPNPTAATKSYAGIQHEPCKRIYNGKKAALKRKIWVPEETGLRTWSALDADSPSEYPSLIHTFFLTHTVGGVFLNPEDKALYDEMLRLQGLGSNTPTGVPYSKMRSMALFAGASSGGTFPVLDGFCHDRARSFLPHLKARTPPTLLFIKSKIDPPTLLFCEWELVLCCDE
ncbi:hypothetical protein Tco_0283048 [Tanacetum coccineum]